jgi:hypothetical protein
MSRSYRKPFITSKGEARKFFKTYANRVARRHWWNARGIRSRLMYKYDISDWRWYWPDDERAKRK